MKPHYFTWKGQKYFADGQPNSLFKWNGTAYVRTTDAADFAAAQEWWETQLPITTQNADGTWTTGPGRGVLDPDRLSNNPTTLLILGVGLLFVILVARR